MSGGRPRALSLETATLLLGFLQSAWSGARRTKHKLYCKLEAQTCMAEVLIAFARGTWREGPLTFTAEVMTVGGSHHSPLARQWALSSGTSPRARPMAHDTAQSFVIQVRTSTGLQNSNLGVPING